MLRRIAHAPLGKITALLLVLGLNGCSGDTPPEPTADASPAATAPATPAPTAQTTPPDNGASPYPEGAKPSVERLLSEARDFSQRGEARQALLRLNEAIQVEPENPEPYLQRAELLSAAELKTQATLDLSRALELDPRNARTFNSRGYLRMAQGDLEGAMEDFSAAVGIDLEYPQPYNNRGLVRISQGESEKALLDFDAALRIDPKYIDAHNNRGYTLMLLKRHDEAVATLTQAIEIDPNYVNAWNNRGLARKALEKHDEACADFTRAIELQSTNPKYYLHRSESLTALGKTDEARKDVEHVVWMERLAQVNRRVSASPSDASTWMERADHLRAGREFDAALADVERAKQLFGGKPEASDAQTLRARILLEQGHADQAIEAANVALKTGHNEQAYSVRGDAHFHLKQYEAAVADYKQARRLDPLVRQACELHAEQLEKSGQIEQAGYFREQAGQLAPRMLPQATDSTDAEAPPFPIDVTQPAPAPAADDSAPPMTAEADSSGS